MNIAVTDGQKLKQRIVKKIGKSPLQYPAMLRNER